MNTKKFRTKTEIIARDNGKINGLWEIALDLGYSAVKLFSPNIIASFPSYAKRVEKDFQYAGNAPAESILYKDLDTEEMWLVGEVAQNMMTSGDTSDSEMSLYGRERYGNPMFSVLVRAGLGLGMQENEFGAPGSSKITVQTGLPEKYLSNDTNDLKECIAGKHHFALKIGREEWCIFDFEIAAEDIYVMSQPKGSLFSVCIEKNGQFHPDAKKYLNSSILVFDPGFGTLDLFPIKSGVVGRGETNPVLGMKRVLQETAKLIKENYNIEVLIPEMQKYLNTGIVRSYDRKNLKSKEYPFDKYLQTANELICQEAITWLTSVVNLIDYNYMIITGGTGAAWDAMIRDRFKEFSTLKLISGNQNDQLPLIYSNVRGYYLYRYNKLGNAQ